jgi:hypothetical protein
LFYLSYILKFAFNLGGLLMTSPAPGSVAVQIPYGWGVTCFGNTSAADTQQVVVADSGGNTICTATGSNGGSAVPGALTFTNGANVYSFTVPSSGSGSYATYTITVTNQTTNKPESVIANTFTVAVAGTVYGEVSVLACDDVDGGVDYNDTIFYVQAWASAG